MKKISIIIPCYNVANLIGRCLTSILQQTFNMELVEILCIDDASTDNTLSILEEWETRYPQIISVLQCQINSRQGTARNIGLEYSSAPWICFIDADDWIEPDYLEKLYTAANNFDCEIVTCQKKRDASNALTLFNNKSTGLENRLLVVDSVEKRKQFIHSATMQYSAWGKIIKKSLLIDNDIYFPEMLTYEDCFWGVLLHFYTSKVYILEECLYHYYINYNSTVLQKNNYYHIDLLTVQLQLWNELLNRNLFDNYKEEIEYEFIFSCYLSFLKVLALRFENPPYSLYQLLKTCVIERIPDYASNKYIQNNSLPPKLSVLLESLNLPLSSSEFHAFCEQIKLLGI